MIMRQVEVMAMEAEQGEWTKQDYLDLLARDRIEGLSQLSQLLYDCRHWEFERNLELDDPGITDDTHMVADYFIDHNDIQRSQYVLKDNPNSALFQLGFTIEEIESYIREG